MSAVNYQLAVQQIAAAYHADVIRKHRTFWWSFDYERVIGPRRRITTLVDEWAVAHGFDLSADFREDMIVDCLRHLKWLRRAGQHRKSFDYDDGDPNHIARKHDAGL